MRLLVTTPTAVVLDTRDVVHVRAEDETGAFGILHGHADFLTVLAVSVIGWRNVAGKRRYVAVRGGVLTLRDGQTVEVATREAVAGDDLHGLEDNVLTRFRQAAEVEQEQRAGVARLQIAVIRQIRRYLNPESERRSPPGPGATLAGGSTS